jgi:type IV secretory pathway component VirB8
VPVENEDRTPPGASLKGLEFWLHAFEAPRVQARRSLIVACLALIVVFAQGVAIMLMLPLKERVPYFIEAETSTGRVIASEKTAIQFKVDQINLRYHLGEWAKNLLTIDSRTKEYLLPASYILCRAGALEDWRRWVDETDKPLDKLVRNPTSRREALIVSVSFISNGVAQIRVVLRERGKSDVRKAIIVHYAILPPTTDEEVHANPIGLNITNFTISDELV